MVSQEPTANPSPKAPLLMKLGTELKTYHEPLPKRDLHTVDTGSCATDRMVKIHLR